MKEKLSKWVSRHILLAPLMLLMLTLMVSCKTEEFTTSSDRKEVHIKERLLPLFSELLHVNVAGKITVDEKGVSHIETPVVTTNSKKKPKVDISINEEGMLNVDVSIPPDTTYVPVRDTETTIEKTIEVEKKLSGWQKFCIRLTSGFLILLVGFGGLKIYRFFKK